jgi:subfamily B ATP-binding cassette protein MsbA
MEKYEQSRLSQAIHSVFKRTIKGVRVKSATHPIMEFLGGIAIAAVIVYGGSQVIAGKQTPGAFFAFITALIMSYEPLKRLANLNANLQEQLAAAGRIFELLDYKNYIADLPEASDIKISKGHIRFHNVCFHYFPDHTILKNVTLDIPPGQTVALVGPSGGGKSTLMNLILRFFEVVYGEICIDNHPLPKFTLQSLRQQIALVSQEVILFDDTVYGNILYGKSNATEGEVIAAAKAAGAHDFIMTLPQGYSTYVGEQGLRLSGGQRQRLSIARAMVKNAPILLMDEPTSALDSESEQMIQGALRSLMRNKTTLIIAHRLATVRDADIIYVIEEGMVTAKGKHHVLLKTSPKYAQWCKIQFEQSENHALA